MLYIQIELYESMIFFDSKINRKIILFQNKFYRSLSLNFEKTFGNVLRDNFKDCPKKERTYKIKGGDNNITKKWW